MSAPPLEYLLGCSDSELQMFAMRRLERAAILKKEKKEVLEELIDALVEAETARILLDTRRLSLTGHPIQETLDFGEGAHLERTAAD